MAHPILAYAATSYSDEQVYIEKTIVRSRADGTYASYVVIRADEELKVNHITIKQENKSAKILSASIKKNWVVWNDPYTTDLHARDGQYVDGSLVVKVMTNGQPLFNITTAMHH